MISRGNGHKERGSLFPCQTGSFSEGWEAATNDRSFASCTEIVEMLRKHCIGVGCFFDGQEPAGKTDFFLLQQLLHQLLPTLHWLRHLGEFVGEGVNH